VSQTLKQKAISREQALNAVNYLLNSEGSVSAVIVMSNDGAMLADGRSARSSEEDQLLEVPELMSFPDYGVHVFFKRLSSCDSRSLYNRTAKALHAASSERMR
jgi:hypothetical protein